MKDIKFDLFDNSRLTLKINKIKNKGKFGISKYSYNKDKFKICTYLHYYDNEQYPFYIGQGTLFRALDLKRSQRSIGWNNKVKDINLVKIEIYKLGISIAESKKLENDLIKEYRDTNNLVNNRKYTREDLNTKIEYNINCCEVAVYTLRDELLYTFESITKCADYYCATFYDIKKAIKNNKPFRGIVKIKII